MPTIIAVSVILLVSQIYASGAPSHLHKANFDNLLKECRIRDRTTLDACLYKIAEQLRPMLPAGVPELNIPPLEPLPIANITFDLADIKIEFCDLQVRGLSQYSTVYTRSTPKRFKYKLGLQFPHLQIIGHYNIRGNILMLPIIGEGPFWAELHNVKVDVDNFLEIIEIQSDGGVKNRNSSEDSNLSTGNAKPTRKNTHSNQSDSFHREARQLRLKNTITDFKFGRSKIHLGNLFNGDKFLGDTVNKFLNENVNDVLQEFKPQVTEKLDLLIRTVFGDAVATLPYTDWIAAVRSKDTLIL